MGRVLDFIEDYRCVSIVGICKNAGKTTVLNKLISECEAAGISTALCSVGRDGERNDVITNKEKPGIIVEAGTMFATTTGLLKYCGAATEHLLSMGIGTPIGEVVVLRARERGFVQISGPSTNARLPALIDFFRSQGAEKVLIDGAVSRKASVSPSVAGCSILCAGADYDPDISKVVADTAHIAVLLCTPGLRDRKTAEAIICTGRRDIALIDGEDNAAVYDKAGVLTKAVRIQEEHWEKAVFAYIPGAVTDRVCGAVLRNRNTRALLSLVTDDASKMMISRDANALLLSRGVRFQTLEPIKLACICVNPHCTTGYPDFNKKRFLCEMRAAIENGAAVNNGDAVGTPVLDVVTNS